MGRDGQSVVEKVRGVLECYIRNGAFSLRFADLLEGSGMSRASLHRTLSEMTENGFLVQPTRRDEYRLGPFLRSAAALASAVSSVVDIARPHMEALRDECRETVVLAELHGAYVVPVTRADGLHEMRMSQEVGQRYPAHAGATGKVLLAHLPPDELEAVLGGLELERLTPSTTTTRAKLDAELERIADAGVAVTHGERVPDAVAISAPVVDAGGRAVAALTISGVASRYEPKQKKRDAAAVKRYADAISADLGRSAARPGAAATA
ncbi:MAG TPA: IclR family transcriptional regulator [Solirubrobacterales bacterium]|jgi:DNA-binding IclR family transcriptional regulator|nr:IclR family transcriptional regulator [Solirubrobacterales bacterium]